MSNDAKFWLVLSVMWLFTGTVQALTPNANVFYRIVILVLLAASSYVAGLYASDD